MAFVTADRVLDTSTSTGTGAMTVSGTAPTGYRTFSAVMSVSDTCYYTIQHATLNEWENGTGTYSSSNTLTRTTVISSSNSNSAVNFSSGSKNVSITLLASKSAQVDPSGASVNAGGGVLAWQSVRTGNFTAVAGNAYPVNTTSGAVTVTLPASPSVGQIVQISDYAGTWITNNCVVNPNGSKISATTSNLAINISRASIAFVYIDTTQGWIVYSTANPGYSTYTANYLVVSGGGGGGGSCALGGGAGGGGAGGLLTGATSFSVGLVYTITVGAGGTGSIAGASYTSGSNSVLNSSSGSVTAVGGGYGGGWTVGSAGGQYSAVSGGSGGGGTVNSTGNAGGSGTTGQGFAGGSGYTANGAGGGGGGGGASAIGGTGTSTTSGAGGAGAASSITGSSVTYAGGGGGGGYTGATAAAGGAGGGGAGKAAGGTATAGTANTGGGGGGAGGTASLTGTGGNGGSGVVILSIPTSNYTGITTGSPTVTTSGSNTILTFTASGSYTA